MEHASTKTLRPRVVRTVLAIAMACALAIACALALKAPAHAEETYTVTFGNTGKSYQVPAGKTLADVKGATIPTMPDTTYVYTGFKLRPFNSNLKATFLGWAVNLVMEDGTVVPLDESRDYGVAHPGFIDGSNSTKQLFSRDGWRNKTGKLGYTSFAASTKVNANLTLWAVYSVPLSYVTEAFFGWRPNGYVTINGERFACQGESSWGYVKTGDSYVSGILDSRLTTTAKISSSWYAGGPYAVEYFWFTNPAGLLEGKPVQITQDCLLSWCWGNDKSKKFPELSYKKTKLTKTYGAKAFTNPLLSITNGKTTYASSNKKVATVSSTGKVTVKGVGKTTITAKSAATSWRKTYDDGDYTDYSHEAGKASYTLTVNPKGTSVQKLVKGKKSFTVSWKKLSKKNLKQITGYQVRYSTSKKFTAKTTKTKTIKASSKAGKKRALTVTKLKGGKKYYVQVRTYKKVGKAKYYSSWSKAKAVKTKK